MPPLNLAPRATVTSTLCPFQLYGSRDTASWLSLNNTSQAEVRSAEHRQTQWGGGIGCVRAHVCLRDRFRVALFIPLDALGSESHTAQNTPILQTCCISFELVLGAFEMQMLSRYIWEIGEFWGQKCGLLFVRSRKIYQGSGRHALIIDSINRKWRRAEILSVHVERLQR